MTLRTPAATLLLLALAVPAAAAPPARPFVPDGNMPRSAVPDEAKWKLTPLFASDADFEQELKQVAAERQKLRGFAGTLAKPKALREALDLYFATRLRTNKLTLYASMRLDTAQGDAALLAMRDRSQQALSELMTDAGFIRREALALDDAALQQALAQEPRLAGYRPYLDEMRRRRTRVLSADAEKALALLGDNLWAEIDLNEIPSDFEKVFNGLLSDIPLPKIKDDKGQEVQLTLSNYGKYRGSEVREVRRATVEGFLATLKRYRHALAAALAGQIDLDVAYARARGYDTAVHAYLDKDDIDTAVYRSLLDAVHRNLKPLHDYVAFRKQVMKLDRVRLYDLYPPLVPTVAMEFPIAEARKILPEALAPLGPEYLAVLKTGLDPKSGWMDLYPHKDKESGAFSSSVYGVHPFVKMNYFDDFDGISTLAHEYGHALHSHLSMTTQPYVTSSYATFIAEIASTFNEKLLSDYLVKRAKNDDERLFLLNHLLESIRTTIYRQTLFAEFELALHTAAEHGTPLTAELLDDTYRRLVTEYYGPDFTVGADDDIEWAYIPHFYYKYYMYAYALGLSSGIALAERVQTGDLAKRDAYVNMLRGGSSRPPLDLLRGAGVDLTRPEAVEAAARLMQKTLDEMRAIVQRRTAR